MDRRDACQWRRGIEPLILPIFGVLLLASASQQQIGSRVEGFTNIVVVRQRTSKLENLVTSSTQFSSKGWTKELDKTFVSMEGDNGLVVVADISALQGPKDRLLSTLVKFGSIDSSGTTIVGKDNKELATALASMSPFDDSRKLLSTGTYRLQIKPQIQVGYKTAKGERAIAVFSPQISPGQLDGLSVIDASQPEEPPQPVKAKDLVFEEYYRQPYGDTQMLQAQKLLVKLADANHESLIRQLFARCSSDFGNGMTDIGELSKKVHDFKDLPFDFTNMLNNQRAIYTDQRKGIPESGAITGIYYGIDIQLLFKGSDGRGKRQVFSISQ